jgi:hypothetical protein
MLAFEVILFYVTNAVDRVSLNKPKMYLSVSGRNCIIGAVGRHNLEPCN